MKFNVVTNFQKSTTYSEENFFGAENFLYNKMYSLRDICLSEREMGSEIEEESQITQEKSTVEEENPHEAMLKRKLLELC